MIVLIYQNIAAQYGNSFSQLLFQLLYGSVNHSAHHIHHKIEKTSYQASVGLQNFISTQEIYQPIERYQPIM